MMEIMSSEQVADNVQGLVYQTVAIIDEQSEGEDRCGIDKRPVIEQLIPKVGMYTVLYQRTLPMVRQYIAASKARR